MAAADDWLHRTFASYDEELLRRVANQLCRPRSHWPVDELLERIQAALQNPVMLDRRLKEQPPAARQVVALMARSRQPRWPAGSLVELAACLGHDDGLAPVLALLEGGLLVPAVVAADDNAPPRVRVHRFDAWLALGTPVVVAPPLVLQRALQEDPGLPACPGAAAGPARAVLEADGLEWPTRLAVLWQQTQAAPLRKTQQGGFFKRDFDRLGSDPLLSSPPSDALAPVLDPGFFAAGLAVATGLLVSGDAELAAGAFTPAWQGPLPPLTAELWAALPWVGDWNAAQGYRAATGPGQPYASAYLLAVLLLSRLGDDEWADPAAIDTWLAAHHPFWRQAKKKEIGAAAFLLGVAYPLRLLQARQDKDGWHVRLSPLGRWVIGHGDAPAQPSFPQTLLAQPTLEILAYRQGLTPELLLRLTHMATWKGLGAACTLQLEPHSVYHALEAGETLETMVQLLERHGMKALPPGLLDSLRTWSNKRERLSVYSSAALFEFGSAADLTEALARGLPAVRLTDRLAVVANEKGIDYRHFRLTGTRDYCLPPEKCVEVEPDGVTLNVDLTRSDLLLESQVTRFAEPVVRPGLHGRRLYRLSPASAAVARANGLGTAFLETWFPQRTGQPLPPAARLLFSAPDASAQLRRELVLHLPSEALADGLQQWPGTASLVLQRLGPTALIVPADDLPALTERLRELGIRLEENDASLKR